MSNLEVLYKISEGTYGIVYKVIDRITSKYYAMKIFKPEDGDVLPENYKREIELLLSVKHENVVKMHRFTKYGDRYGLLFDYYEKDLRQHINNFKMMKKKFSLIQIKSIMFQLLCGVNACHENWFMHRDVKPANILIEKGSTIKLCDFGLARLFKSSEMVNFTNPVVTLWYRSPNILCGDTAYDNKVDIWSIGCIFAELINMEVLFKDKTEIGMLKKIFKLLGTPKKEDFFYLNFFDGYKFDDWKQNRIPYVFKDFDHRGVDLLMKMLVLDPSKRITAKKALRHDFFLF